MPDDAFISRIFSLDGQVVVLTGASSGLGRHFARTLHSAGATVVLAARRERELTELADELANRADPVVTDISDDTDCERLADHAMTRYGRIDTLVNCAGMTHPDVPRRFGESMDGFRRALDVNVSGLFSLSQIVASRMADAGSGCIVNVSSIFGQVGGSTDMAYAASKGAVDSLTRAMASLLARKGVRVNALAPAFFHTDLSGDFLADDNLNAWILRRCPMNRLGQPAELDGALLFLCSAASSYCTGQVIAVDGGWTGM